jgi:membrane protein DedA with SNARE-associated domain
VIEVRVARFIWAHRTVAAGLAAIWNTAFIFLGPLITPPQSGVFLRSGIALIAAVVFATLFVVSLIHDRRRRKRVGSGVSAAR